MKEQKRRQSLSGAVLIMVITVMIVLIIMLMATLTVVTTASRRINTKFEENQAYYTARSALDVFWNKMLSDKTYYMQTASGGDVIYHHDDDSTSDKMKQGLRFQLDLYEITAQSGGNVTQNKLNNLASAIPTGNDKKEEYKYYFGTQPDGYELNSISYQVDYHLPSVASPTGSYGMWADNYDYSTGSAGTATITVEVLERVYDLGSYGGNMVPEGDYKAFLEKSATSPSGADYSGITDDQIAEAVFNGVRSKDTMRIKVTAVTDFQGFEGVATVITSTKELDSSNSSKALTSFAGGGSDNMSVIGGAAMANDITWSNQGWTYGSIYSEKNFSMNTGAQMYLTDDENFFIGGDFNILNNIFKLTGQYLSGDDDKKPFLYVGGKTVINNMTDATFKSVDILTHGIEITQNGFNPSADCNIYCEGDADFSNGNSVTIKGNMYVNGNVYVNNQAGNFYYDNSGFGAWHLNGVEGNLYYTGDIIDKNTGTVYTPETTYPKIIKSTNEFSLGDLTKFADPNSGESSIQLSLPVGTNPSGLTKTVQVHTDNFNNYYHVDPADGKIIIDTATGLPERITAQEKAAKFFPSLNLSDPLTKESLGVTTKMEDLSNFKTSGFSYLDPTTGNPSSSFYGNNINCEVDTDGGEVSCYLDTGSNHRNGIYVSGGGTLNLIVNGSYSNETAIYVANDTSLRIIGDTSTSNLWFAKIIVYDEERAKSVQGNGNPYPLNVGEKTGCGIIVPKINYYISGNGNFGVQNNAYLTGYIYAPWTYFELSAASSPNVKTSYNGNDIGNKQVAVVGSLLCNDMKLRNETGVAYINPDLGSGGAAGDPIFNWQAYLYTRK